MVDMSINLFALLLFARLLHRAVAVAVAVSGAVAVAVAVPVAGLTKRCSNHIQKDFLINVWDYRKNVFLTCIVKLFF